MWDHHSHKIEDAGRFARLVEMGKDNGFDVRHVATKYVRGWPQPSQRPYQVWKNDRMAGAYGSLSGLEAGLQNKVRPNQKTC